MGQETYDELIRQRQLMEVLKELFLQNKEVMEHVFSVRVLNDSKASRSSISSSGLNSDYLIAGKFYLAQAI